MSNKNRSRRAFSLIELLVVLTVIAVLALLCVAVISTARRSSQQATCSSNMRQIGQAIAMYSQDYDVVIPPSLDDVVSVGYLKDTRLLRCPLDGSGRWGSDMDCSGSDPLNIVTPRSYLYVKDVFFDNLLDKYVRDNTIGLLVCQQHGERRKLVAASKPCYVDYVGKMLRLNADGSVKSIQFAVDDNGGAEWCSLFSNSSDCSK